MRHNRRPTTPVISSTGSRDTRIVGALRVGSALATIGALVWIGQIFDDGAHAGSVIAVIAFALLAAAVAFTEFSYGGRAARAEERRIRREILTRQYSAASDPSLDKEEYPPGRVIQMMTDGAERVTEFRQVYFGSTLAAMLIPVFTLFYIGIFIDATVGFVVLALVPLVPILIGGFMKAFRKTSANSRKQRAALTVRYLDAIRNLVTIRLHGAGERITAELREAGERNRGAIMKLLAGNQIVIIVTDGVFSLVLICTTVWLTILRGEQLTTGQALTIVMLVVLLLEPLQQVAGFFYIGMGGIASQKEIRGYLSNVPGSPVAVEGASTADPAPTGEASGLISLRSVNFDYGRGPVLEDLNLTVRPGTRVAIMGPSGAGKSTLLGLLRGSIPPQGGSIEIDGHDLAGLAPAQVRSLSATVSQSTWMFTGTIADNLRLARQDATEEQMWEALRAAHIDVEVERMPHGLHTYLGEGAALISGGQAQRLSLARALLSGRRTLLLDEPTSQVDIESEARIIDALASLPPDRTLLMVTHRPSLLRIADEAYTLSAGRLEVLETTRA